MVVRPEMLVESPLVRRLGVLALVTATVAAGTAAAAAQAGTREQRPGPWCGGALWRLMALSDPQRGRIDFRPVETSIAQIAKLKPPRAIGPTRSTRFQRHRWRMAAVIDRYRIASNGEIVLILYSIQTARYMNVYFPNPRCLGPRSRDRAAIMAARKAFTSRCPRATAEWQLLGASVELAGIGFWNPSKATRGALPNGAELRPLTNFKIVDGCPGVR
jgi:hypothetical protein